MRLKAVYSVAEVAKLFGLSDGQTRRRLQEAGVIVSKGRGKKQDVVTSELRARMPGYWASALDVLRLSS